MNEKEHFIKVLSREYQKTLRVLLNFPPEKIDIKPHERSRSAIELGRVFINEQHIMQDAVLGKIDFTKFGPSQKQPSHAPGHVQVETWQEVVAGFELAFQEFLEILKKTDDEELNKTVDFGGEQTRRMSVLWEMLHDQIHHRGQFSVYLRMAGGKVPGIYGPSADEPM